MTTARRPSGSVTTVVTEEGDLPRAVGELCDPAGRPVLVVVGGADGMSARQSGALVDLFASLVVAIDRWHAVVVDGGTDAGAMRAIGRARTAAGAGFPLVGVVCASLVGSPSDHPGTAGAGGRHLASLDPHHTVSVLVPGEAWGDEVPWISAVAATIAGPRPSMTVAVNGGRITYDDVAASVRARRPVVVLAGSGRTADAIAAALNGSTHDPRAAELAASGWVRQVHLRRPDELIDVLTSTLVRDG